MSKFICCQAKSLFSYFACAVILCGEKETEKFFPTNPLAAPKQALKGLHKTTVLFAGQFPGILDTPGSIHISDKFQNTGFMH